MYTPYEGQSIVQPNQGDTRNGGCRQQLLLPCDSATSCKRTLLWFYEWLVACRHKSLGKILFHCVYMTVLIWKRLPLRVVQLPRGPQCLFCEPNQYCSFSFQWSLHTRLKVSHTVDIPVLSSSYKWVLVTHYMNSATNNRTDRAYTLQPRTRQVVFKLQFWSKIPSEHGGGYQFISDRINNGKLSKRDPPFEFYCTVKKMEIFLVSIYMY